MILTDEFLQAEAAHWFAYLKRKTGTVKATMTILESAFTKLTDQVGKVSFNNERSASAYLRITITHLLKYNK